MTLDLSRVALDLDGTVIRSNSFVCDLINYRTGANLAYNDIIDYQWWDTSSWRPVFNETYDLIDDLGLRPAIAPYDERTPAILYDLTHGYNDQGRVEGPLTIVTYNNQEAEESIREWFRLRAGIIGRDRLEINCMGRPQYDGDRSIPDKVDLDFDVFVDDNPKLATKIGTEYPDKLCLLANTGLNENVSDEHYGNVFRWHSWVQLEDILMDIGRHDGDWEKAIEGAEFIDAVAELPD